jgi:molybdopterin synthase catalytic subunit
MKLVFCPRLQEDEFMLSCVVSKDNAISFPELFDEFTRSLTGHEGGAIVSFTGIVREDAKPRHASEPRTTRIEIDAIDDVSGEILQRIAASIETRPGIVKVVIIHFTGVFDLGEPLVHVFVCAAHRQEAFEALEDSVNAYKRETPLWKKEIYSDGSSEWVRH